jgi:hypothetical protein
MLPLIICLMAAMLTALAVLGGSFSDMILMRYPGAARRSGEKLDIKLTGNVRIARWAVYLTPVELTTVKRWYRRLLQVPPNAPVRSVKNCVWLSNSRTPLRNGYFANVMLCTGQKGTTISVYQGVVISR